MRVEENAPMIASAIHSRSSSPTRRTFTSASSLHGTQVLHCLNLFFRQVQDLGEGPFIVLSERRACAGVADRALSETESVVLVQPVAQERVRVCVEVRALCELRVVVEVAEVL